MGSHCTLVQDLDIRLAELLYKINGMPIGRVVTKDPHTLHLGDSIFGEHRSRPVHMDDEHVGPP